MLALLPMAAECSSVHVMLPLLLTCACHFWPKTARNTGEPSLCEVNFHLQGCHAGLLQHQDLAANKGISNALNSIMRQFSGLDTEACDMEVRLLQSTSHHSSHAWAGDSLIPS